ncbi:MAG: DNA ligase D, partial [Christensenellales bacterium]
IAEGIQKAQKNPFDNAPFQLARLTERVPEGEDRLFEVKYDGYRIMAYVEGNKARLVTRNGNDLSGKFGEISGALAAFSKGRAMVLDGEIVVADRSGKTDFQALQSFLKKKEQKSLTYIVFDLLALDGEDLREKPLIQRKETLNKLLADAPDNIQYSGHVAGKGGDCFKAACAADFEGIVGKRADSRYLGTRNSDWIKLKCRKRQEFVVGGYTVSGKGPRKISSLLLGVYDGGALVYVGRAGTGLNVQEAEELEKLFGGIKAAKSPFESALKARAEEKIVWLKPLTAAEVEYAEITADNVLRQASFKGLRTDKDVKEIVIERAESGENAKNTESAGVVVGGIKISNPDKIIFTEPQITKADVVRYYAEISKAMLPYVAGRILSIVRCPKGVAEACFYKKHPDPSSSKIVTVPVPASDGETDEYFYIADAAGLIYEAQMGTLEFHIWGSRAAELEKPDLMVFDLDPDEGMPLATVRQGVKDLKSVLDGFSLKSYLKTSGGKGYHVVVPFLPEADWEAFRAFAKKVAQIMEERWPSRYTSNMRKASRGGKIYIDWVRNGRSATSVAPYSLRARPSAPVSAPISWQELETIPPDGIKLNDALSRVKRGLDPWKSLSKNKQHLKSI